MADTENTCAPSVLSGGGKSFVKHVFNFDDDSKNEIMNIIQYSLLAIIPVVALNKSIQRFVPEVDEQKGSLEILVEVMGQTTVMFVGIMIIHRLITYIPTYSNISYAEFNITSIILGFLVIVLSLQTKLGEKVNILIERIIEIVDGKVNIKDSGGEQYQQQPTTNIGVTQPISQSISQPISPQIPAPQQKQASPEFQQMYSQTTTPLQNAASPNGQQAMESPLMAANEAFGGSFGSAF